MRKVISLLLNSQFFMYICLRNCNINLLIIMRYAILTAFLGVFFLTSCEKKPQVEVHIAPEVMDSIYNNIYAGVLPCPDCEGIETYIKIHRDSTISRYFYYKNKNRLPELKIGTWTRNDSIFTAEFDREKLFYKLKNGHTILRVGSDLKEVKGRLAEQYIFKITPPVSAESFLGEYILGDTLQKHRRLLITKTSKEDILQLGFSLYDSNDSIVCNKNILSHFTKEKALETDLSKLSDSLSGKLKVLFTMEEAHVFFDNLTGTFPNFCEQDSTMTPVGTYHRIEDIKEINTEE